MIKWNFPSSLISCLHLSSRIPYSSVLPDFAPFQSPLLVFLTSQIYKYWSTFLNFKVMSVKWNRISALWGFVRIRYACVFEGFYNFKKFSDIFIFILYYILYLYIIFSIYKIAEVSHGMVFTNNCFFISC